MSLLSDCKKRLVVMRERERERERERKKKKRERERVRESMNIYETRR